MSVPAPASDVVVAATAFTPERLLQPAWVGVRDGLITAVGTGEPPRAERRWQLPEAWVALPGLVDMHVHGAGGGNFTALDREDVVRACRALARAGVTTAAASLVTAPLADLEAALDLLASTTEDAPSDGAALAGIHLEGPFLAEKYRGSHDAPSLRHPDVPTMRRLAEAARGRLRMVTLAPELPGAIDVVRHLADTGVTVAVGHTGATAGEIVTAVDAGARVATHLYNGMRPPHHREPGPALALLDDERTTVELINDGVHVHPAAARVAARAAGTGRLALISDAVAATGAPDGDYKLGQVDIRSRDGRVETADGRSLGGGVVTLDAALLRAVQVLRLDLQAAVHAATLTPARALGVDDQVGCLEPGRRADLCVLDESLQVAAVMKRGRWLVEPQL